MRTTSGRRRPAWLHRLDAVCGLTDHLYAGRRLQQLAKTRANECLIVGDEDAGAHASGR